MAQPWRALETGELEHGEDGGIPCVAVKCVDIWRNTSGEGGHLACADAEARKRGEQMVIDPLVVHAVNDED